MMSSGREAEHLVIGGGPAGAMAAIILASTGRSVVLVEKKREAHHKVCGEFLSREAVHYLRQVGVDPVALGAQVIRRVCLSSGRRVLASPLPFEALSLSRSVLDEALIGRAQEKGCTLLRGSEVESLASSDGSGLWIVTLASGETVRSPSVFLATGKHDLRGFPRPEGEQNDLTGFKMHWQLAPAQIEALRGCMDLYLFPGGYGGLSLIENDIANLCLVVRRSILRAGCAWPELLAGILAENSHLRRLLDGAQPLWAQPLAISRIPYGYLRSEGSDLWRIGDQAAVIPSFTGDGISIALHSGALAARMLLRGEGAAAYHRALHADLRRSMRLATWLSRAAVTAPGRAAAIAAASVFPRLMRAIAASTRIPQRALIGREAPKPPSIPPRDFSATPQPE